MNHTIASKIKKAMLACSAVCLGVLGIVALLCISISGTKTVADSMQGTVSVAAGLVEREVAAMKQFAIDEGVESSEIFMDHAGFSTYEIS